MILRTIEAARESSDLVLLMFDALGLMPDLSETI